MPIKAVYVVPHGCMLLKPDDFPDYKSKITAINDSFYMISDEIYKLNPDLIVLTTPHGISLLNSFGVYCGYEGFGTAEWQGNFTEFSVNLEFDRKESLNFIEFIKQKNKTMPIEGIVSFIESMPIPLRWSEVVPPLFLLDRWKKNAIDKTEYSEPRKPFPKFMVISVPRSRLDLSGNLLEKSVEFGQLMGEYFGKSEKNVVFLQSGDLAHTHGISIGKFKKDPPPYPIQILAFENFDKIIGKWAEDPIKEEGLLLKLADVLQTYLSCGYVPLVVMQGILKILDKEKKAIESEVLCNISPTYFGMMISRHLIG